MDNPSETKRPYRPRRAGLTWIDFLVIAATVLVFGAVVMSSRSAERTLPTLSALTPNLPLQPTHAADDLAVIGARIKLATGPWS